MSAAEDVARWMKEQVQRDGQLNQSDAAVDIQQKFGEDHVYENENGNLAISTEVLKAFRKLTKDSVVWEPGERMWRKRLISDDKNSRRA